jgi:hypothetical protein
MSAARDPYVKVYYGIADDARFEHVFGNDAALAWWLRLLLIADGTWPASAHIPAACKPKALHSLVEAGLIELMGNHRFRVHGMDAERAKRSEHASQASRSRWSSNAASIPVSKPPSNATTTAPSNPQNMPTNSDELRRTQKAPLPPRRVSRD